MALSPDEVRLELDRIVERIAAALKPEEIILFGSGARGDHREESDAELLIMVKDGPGNPANLAAHGRKLPLDIAVYPHSRLCSNLEWQHDVVSYAVEEGQVVYESRCSSLA